MSDCYKSIREEEEEEEEEAQQDLEERIKRKITPKPTTPVPYEQSRAYWINVWAGQALNALMNSGNWEGERLCAKTSIRAAQFLADEIFGKEDEK